MSKPRPAARVQRKSALLKAGALQQAILDSASFSSMATDEHGVIQVFNVGAQRMLGYSADEVLNRLTPADLSDPQELLLRAQALSTEFATPIAPGFEALVFKASRGIEDMAEQTCLRRDGSRLPVLVSVTALHDRAGVIIGYLLIVTDNTSRQRTEAEQVRLDAALRRSHAELQAAKTEAERANQAKSDFLSSMSHELRSPLNAILGFTQLIESGTPKPTAEQQESCEHILQAGWYLLELINEVLDLSMIEAGKLSLSIEPLLLSDLLTDCLAMVEPQARRRGISVRLQDGQGPLLVRADRTRAQQVLVNLLSNAIKYNRPGGSVQVECTPCPEGRTRMTVRDTGGGLEPAQLAHLFEPFNRLGQELGSEEGTGIGLVVSQRLVELMGGTLGVSSVVGEGSAFWVDLPASAAPDDAHVASIAQATSPPEPPPPDAPPLRTVLCVEDNPANLKLVARLLARRPALRLLTAKDGASGVALAQAMKPDVILMDINMPGIGGLEALGLLAADSVTSHIPVVAVSANAVQRDIDKGLSAGFFGYLTKPIQLSVFDRTLDQALELAGARARQRAALARDAA